MKDQFIPLSVPNLSGNELKYVTEAVRTEWVSTVGSYVRDLETMIAKYVDVPDAVACQSGTAGLHIALMLCGVTAADIVLAPSLTFIAAVNPIRYIGAAPVFMDCDDSLCMDPLKVERFCAEECELRGEELVHKATGKVVRAMTVVHVFGNMADMPAMLALSKKYHFRLVEDATEALGTHFSDGRCENAYAGTMGDMGVYSFNGNKIITTGGGGMIVSRDQALLNHARHLTTQAKSDPLNFEHDEVGYNYRLTNLQAALGIAQMEQLEDFIEVKNRNYEHYCRRVSELGDVTMLPFRKGIRTNHWFYSLMLGEAFPLMRDELIAALSKRQVQSRPIWGLICDQFPYRGEIQYHVEKARHYAKHVVNVPCSTNLPAEDVDAVITAILDCVAEKRDAQ